MSKVIDLEQARVDRGEAGMFVEPIDLADVATMLRTPEGQMAIGVVAPPVPPDLTASFTGWVLTAPQARALAAMLHGYAEQIERSGR